MIVFLHFYIASAGVVFILLWNV